jgi:SSS family solute:Na+ symporter
MALFVFIILVALSIVLAVLSRRGLISNNLNDLLVASRSFGAILLFFVTVGEIYGIGTMIGVPGATYSKGSSYMVWYLGYILLAYPVGYFVNPAVWRIGKLTNSITLANFYSWRFESKWLGFLVAVVAILFMLPWAQMQFTGLSVIIRYLGVQINNSLAVILAVIIAFIYVAAAGVRSSAWIAVMKDLLMVAAIVIGGIVAAVNMPGGWEGVFKAAFEKFPDHLVVATQPITKNVTFLISTILAQSAGLYMVPFVFQYVFTGASEKIVRRNQMLMPLYMFMYVFLMIASFFCLVTVSGLKNPDDAFMGMIVKYLPGWVVGVCAAGGALTCLLVLAVVALTIGGLASNDIIGAFRSKASSNGSVAWTRVIIGACLVVSVLLTLYWPMLMVGMINMAYFGFIQFLPGVLSIISWRRATKWGVGAGLLAGVVCVFLLNMFSIAPYGLNKGLVALVVNFIVLVAVTYMTPYDASSAERLEKTKKVKKVAAPQLATH